MPLLTDEDVGLGGAASTNLLSDADVGLGEAAQPAQEKTPEELLAADLGRTPKDPLDLARKNYQIAGRAAVGGEDFMTPHRVAPGVTLGRADRDQMIPTLSTDQDASTLAKVGAGAYNTVAGVPNFLLSKTGAATTAALALAPELLPAAALRYLYPAVRVAFGGLMAKGAAEAAGKASVTGDPQDITEAAGAAALGLAPEVAPAAKAGLGKAKAGYQWLEQKAQEPAAQPWQGPLATGAVLRPPVSAPEAEPLGPPVPTPKQLRKASGAPEVPATPPEAERGTSVIEEIRQKNADTVAKVQKLYPQSSREEARKLRNSAFPQLGPENEPPMAQAMPDAEPEPGRTPTTGAEEAFSPGPTPAGTGGREADEALQSAAAKEAAERRIIQMHWLQAQQDWNAAMASGDRAAAADAGMRLMRAQRALALSPGSVRTPPTPKPPVPRVPAARPEVPATPPEAERNLTEPQEIRQRNLKTVRAIQEHFKEANLTREQAREKGRAAWGQWPPPPGTEGDSQAPPPEPTGPSAPPAPPAPQPAGAGDPPTSDWQKEVLATLGKPKATSEEALRLGSRMQTLEELEWLQRELQDAMVAVKMAGTDFNARMAAGHRKQMLEEALGAATKGPAERPIFGQIFGENYKPPFPGGKAKAVAPNEQAPAPEAAAPDLEAPAREAEKLTGFTFRQSDQTMGAFPVANLAKLDPKTLARMEALGMTKRAWEFTDMRRDSPYNALTFYVPEGTSTEEIVKKMQEKTRGDDEAKARIKAREQAEAEAKAKAQAPEPADPAAEPAPPQTTPEKEWLGKPLSHWESLDPNRLRPTERLRLAKSMGVEDKPSAIKKRIDERLTEIKAQKPKGEVPPPEPEGTPAPEPPKGPEPVAPEAKAEPLPTAPKEPAAQAETPEPAKPGATTPAPGDAPPTEEEAAPHLQVTPINAEDQKAYSRELTRQLQELGNQRAELEKQAKELERRIYKYSRGNYRTMKRSARKTDIAEYQDLQQKIRALSNQMEPLDQSRVAAQAVIDEAGHAQHVNNAKLPLLDRMAARSNLRTQAPPEFHEMFHRALRAELRKRFPDASKEELHALRWPLERLVRSSPGDWERQLAFDPELNLQGRREKELREAVPGQREGSAEWNKVTEETRAEVAKYITRPHYHQGEPLSRAKLDELKARIAGDKQAAEAEQEARIKAQELEEQRQKEQEAKLLVEAQKVVDSVPKRGKGAPTPEKIRDDLTTRIKLALDELIAEDGTTLALGEDGRYAAQGGKFGGIAFGEVTPKGDKFTVTVRGPTKSGVDFSATVPTREVAEWAIKAFASMGSGRAIVAVPGDGLFMLQKNGERLLQTWQAAQRIETSTKPKRPWTSVVAAHKPPPVPKTAGDWQDMQKWYGLRPADKVAEYSPELKAMAQKIQPEGWAELTTEQVDQWVEALAAKRTKNKEREQAEEQANQVKGHLEPPPAGTGPYGGQNQPEGEHPKGPGIIGMGGALTGEVDELPTFEDMLSGEALAPKTGRNPPATVPATTTPTLRTWGEIAQEAGLYWRGVINRLAGYTFPRTTAVDHRLGELGARWVSAHIAARPQAEVFAADVIGNSGIDPNHLGAALTEDNLRSIKASYQEKADEAANAPEIIEELRGELKNLADLDEEDPQIKAEQRKILKEIDRLKKLTPADAVHFEQLAKGVKSFIGAEGFPFADEEAFQAFLDAPKTKDAVKRHIELWRNTVEPQYREAMQLDEEVELPTRGAQTGARINLRAALPDEDTRNVVRAERRGNQLATLRKKSPFGVQAMGNAEAYHVNYYDLMENTFGRQMEIAAKNKFEKALVEAGHAVIARKGQRVMIGGRAAEEFTLKQQRRVFPGGGGRNESQSIYINPRLAMEYRIGSNLDKRPPEWISRVTKPLNVAALAGLTDVSVHVHNQILTLATAPGMSGRLLTDSLLSAVPGRPDVWLTLARVLTTAYRDNRAQLAGLAEIGATRADYPKGKIPVWRDISFGVHFMDKATRLALDDAYKRLAQQGCAENTETARREFVNQIGQYNKRAQPYFMRLMRDTGLAPFVTAGTTFNRLGVRAMTLNPGVRATSLPAALALKANMLAKLVGTFSTVMLLNYLLTRKKGGGVMGRPGVPLGSIDTGNSDRYGRPLYIPGAAFSMFERGARVTGLRGFAQSKARGLDTTTAADAAGRDMINAALSPWVGPAPKDVVTAVTGNALAYGVPRVSAVAPPGKSQTAENVRAALVQANPVFRGLDQMTQPGGTAMTPIMGQLPRVVPQAGKPPGMMRDYPRIVARAKATEFVNDVIRRARAMEAGPAEKTKFLQGALEQLPPQDRPWALREFQRRRVLP